MGGAMLGKSSIQLSVDEWGSVPCLLFTWDQTMVEVVKIMATSFKKSHAGTATPSAPSPAAGHCQPTPPLETSEHSGQVWVSLLWGHYSFLLGPGAQGSVCALQESVSPVLCKFWRLYGGAAPLQTQLEMLRELKQTSCAQRLRQNCV